MTLQDRIDGAGEQVFSTEPNIENLIKFLTALKNNAPLVGYLESQSVQKFGKPYLGTENPVDFTGDLVEQSQVDEVINWIEKWSLDIVLLDEAHSLDPQALYALRLNGIGVIAEANCRAIDGVVVPPELYSIDLYFDLGSIIVSGW